MSEPVVKCRAVKHGGVPLHCSLPDKHEGWHKAVYTDSREIDYDGSHHEIHMTETVIWEPIDYITRHLLAGRDDRAQARPA